MAGLATSAGDAASQVDMSIKRVIGGWFGGAGEKADQAAGSAGAAFGASESQHQTVRSLESVADLDAALAESFQHPVVLFKHSTRCPTSYWADGQYRSFVSKSAATTNTPSDPMTGEAPGGVVFTHLNLLRHRDVSAAIADRLGVTHQSPQAIVVRNGKATWHASHGGISEAALEQAVRAAVNDR
jgi:bacillithiol system protein YtxJ